MKTENPTITGIGTNEQQLIIIEPDGPQGPKLGLGVSSMAQMKTFDESVNSLPKSERKDTTKLARLAKEAGMSVIKP